MIEKNFALPPLNQRTSVEILHATDPERVGCSHALSANELRLDCRRWGRHDRMPRWQMPVIAVALDRIATGFANPAFVGRDRLLLRSSRSGDANHFFCHD